MSEIFFNYLASLPEPLGKEEQNTIIKNYFALKTSLGKGCGEFVDCEYRDLLITHNLRLVFKIAKELSNNANDVEELFSVGYTALAEYLDKYDISKGVEFSTYIYYCVKGQILKEINMKLRRKNEEIENCYMSYLDNADGDVFNLFDVIKSDDNFVEDILSSEYVDYLLGFLSEREREIVELRLFPDINGVMTYDEIGKCLGVAGMTVKRIYSSAISKLKDVFLNGNETFSQTFLNLVSEYIDGVDDERIKVALEHFFGLNGREKMTKYDVCNMCHMGYRTLTQHSKRVEEYVESRQKNNIKLTQEDVLEYLDIMQNPTHKLYIEHLFGLNGRKKMKPCEVDALYGLRVGAATSVKSSVLREIINRKKDRQLNGVNVKNLTKGEVVNYVSTLPEDSVERKILEMLFGINGNAFNLSQICTILGIKNNGTIYDQVKKYKQNVVNFVKTLNMERE